MGNFKTSLKGVELFKYDRTHYGAQADIDLKTGDFRRDSGVRYRRANRQHAYVEYRGTGGSLYCLPHREVVEGSEQVISSSETAYRASNDGG